MLASCIRFKVVVQAWFPRQGHHFTCQIVGGVVIDYDLAVKLNSWNFFPGVFVGELRKFMLVKISSYVVCKYHAAYATPMHHTTGRISYYQKLSLTPHTQGVACARAWAPTPKLFSLLGLAPLLPPESALVLMSHLLLRCFFCGSCAVLAGAAGLLVPVTNSILVLSSFAFSFFSYAFFWA